MPHSLQVDLSTLKVVSDSRVTWVTSVPILVFIVLSVLDLGPMYATDRQTSDRQTSDTHRLRRIWGRGHNNGFRRVFNCCWRERVKALQFSLSNSADILSYRRKTVAVLQETYCDNIVLRNLTGLIRFEMLGIAAKYDINSIYFSTGTVKNDLWSSFVNIVRFQVLAFCMFFSLNVRFRFYSVFMCYVFL